MKIGNKEIAENDLFFWIEEGQASLGDINTAYEFIDKAVEINADGIEFQLAIPEEFYIKNHPNIEHYKKIQFSNEQIIGLIKYCHIKKISFLAAVLSPSLIELLTKNNCDAFVINASDINNPSIIDPIVNSQIPFFISLPLATIEEINWVINRCTLLGAKNFALMQGQHTMASGESGVMLEDTNLGFIKTLKRMYSQMVGFIDHSRNIYMPSIAHAAGANFISKHLFLKKNFTGPDWFVCIDPDEMKTSIKAARDTNKSLKEKKKKMAKGENIDKRIMRRSIVAACDIPSNSIITKDMLAFKRPGNGHPPCNNEIFIGKKTLIPIKQDDLLNIHNVDLS